MPAAAGQEVAGWLLLHPLAGAMGHGGYLLGAEHGGLVLEGGVTFGVLAALTGVR